MSRYGPCTRVMVQQRKVAWRSLWTAISDLAQLYWRKP